MYKTTVNRTFGGRDKIQEKIYIYINKTCHSARKQRKRKNKWEEIY